MESSLPFNFYATTLITTPPTTLGQSQSKFFCDNQGIIQQTQQLLPPNNLYPRDSIQDYYDLYSMIACIANTFHPIPVKLHHVKGHQDQQQKQNGKQNNQPLPPLSLEAQLNIQCDTIAARALTSTYQHGKHTPIIPLPSAYPYLYIGKWLIVRKLQQTLRDAAVTPNYREYMLEKHQWANQDCNNVNWNALPLAMNWFNTNDHQRLQKFLHDWLPLNHSHHASGTATTTLCPSCHKQDEDFWHFLECHHQPRPNLFRTLQQNLTKLHLRYNIDPDLYQMLWQGLCSIRFNSPLPEPQGIYPEALHQLYYDQKSIGWDQLYYGCLAVSWAHQINYNSNGNVNGTIFYSQVTTHIWQYILDTWKQCNLNLHSKSQADSNRSNLWQQVLNLMHTAKQYPQLEHLVNDNTEANIMKRSIPAIRQWIIHSTTTIKNHIAAERKQAILKHRIFKIILSKKPHRPKTN